MSSTLGLLTIVSFSFPHRVYTRLIESIYDIPTFSKIFVFMHAVEKKEREREREEGLSTEDMFDFYVL